MPAKDQTEAKYALMLAHYKWGPTGFHCPHCGHDHGYQLAPKRPRSFQCARCRRQTSVTSGTIMHGSKLPLRIWFARGEWFETGDMSSSNAFAKEHGIASSSAWHLTQRFMTAVDLGVPLPLGFGGHLVIEGLRCRRPKPLAELPEETPPALREKNDRFLRQRRPLIHEVVLAVGGRELVLVDGCPGTADVDRANADPLELRVAIEHRGLERWIASFLHGRFRTVCVRWTARYVRHLLQIWNRMRDGVTRPAKWLGAVMAGPRLVLRELRAAAVAVAAAAAPATG